MARRVHKKGFRKFKRAARRRFNRKKRSGFMSVVRQVGGFPDSYKCKLMMSVAGIPFASGLTYSTIGYKLNTPYKADSGSSVIPLGWTTITDVYDKYFVYASKIFVNFTNYSTANSLRVLVCPIDQDKATASNFDSMAVNPHAVVRHCTQATSGRNICSISKFIPVGRLAGIRPYNQTYENGCGMTGSVNSSATYAAPFDSWYWNMMIQTTNGAAIETSKVFIDVRIEYYVVFFERLPQGY